MNLFNTIIKYIKEAWEENRRTFILYLIGVIVFLFLFIMMIIPRNTEESTTPEKYTPFETEKLVENIIIENFDDYQVGVMHEKKYYRLQYGVYVEDESYVGSYIGNTLPSATLNNIEDDVFVFEELGAQGYPNAEIYTINSDDKFIREHVLLLKDQLNEGLNGYWVLACEDLEKKYTPLLIDKTPTIQPSDHHDWVCFCGEEYTNEIKACSKCGRNRPQITNAIIYPLKDDKLQYSTDTNELLVAPINTESETFKQYMDSLKRISLANAQVYSSVDVYLLLMADGSGLSYGNYYIYNYQLDESYLSAIAYEKVIYSCNNMLLANIMETYMPENYEYYKNAYPQSDIEVEISTPETAAQNIE